MCGIAGLLDAGLDARAREQIVRRMLGAIRHRGPDQFGIVADSCVALGNARLSIIDLQSGQQPIANEDQTLWIVFNGEIFNYVELRQELEARGHRFSTHTDTEVILHLFEDFGPDCLRRLNGQFAIAIWNTKDQSLFLARDRLGVRPVFYVAEQGRLSFASEIKALFCDPRVSREMDPVSLDQIFTFWAPLSPRTAFRGVHELPAGHYLTARNGQVTIGRYWELAFTEPDRGRSIDDYAEQLRSLLVDATRLRLRADVPVGAYLSGGLDSSTIASIVRRFTSNKLSTFSIAFEDPSFDESEFQLRMARELGTEHQVVQTSHADIGRVMPEVIWHTEVPLLRTAPAPMFLLSKLVRRAGFKVVLTGEGADEFFCGYDIFKEAAIRRFWARQPGSQRRPMLFQRLYQDIGRLSQSNPAFLNAFFKDGLGAGDCPWYSHLIRWRNNRRAGRFLRGFRGGRDGVDEHLQSYPLPPGFPGWDATQKAQSWEIGVFLSQYLLSSQGDRVAMANSVEGRFPFLDFRMVEFANGLPTRMKLQGLRDKHLLRRAVRDWLPAEVSHRPKRPYRAPIYRSFFPEGGGLDYVGELLSPSAVDRAELLDGPSVQRMVSRVQAGAALGETDDMALAGMITTQLLHHQFVEHFPQIAPVGGSDDVKCCLLTT